MRDDKFETHIEMWKHYNTLRQGKTTGFLNANSILVAITGFLFKEPRPVWLIMLISAVGILVCASWFLLLKRNAAYIKNHRQRAGGGNEHFWQPRKTGTPPSRWLDPAPSVAFFVFWVGVFLGTVPLPAKM